jgi:hypothetical protein
VLSSSTRIISTPVTHVCSRQCKMEDVDICPRQRVVIEFLAVTGSSLIEIHRCLGSVYAIDVSSVRCWVCHFRNGERDIRDKPCSG